VEHPVAPVQNIVINNLRFVQVSRNVPRSTISAKQNWGRGVIITPNFEHRPAYPFLYFRSNTYTKQEVIKKPNVFELSIKFVALLIYLPVNIMNTA
jgi:hypothetical protein